MVAPSRSEDTGAVRPGFIERRFVRPFTQRSEERELLDDLQYADWLEPSLRELAGLNSWLGGHRALRSGIAQAVERLAKATPGLGSAARPLRVVDAGCGSGDGLRVLAKWCRRRNLHVELIGVDANPHTIEIARRASKDFDEISFRSLDVFGDDFLSLKADLVTATLFCHHFDDTTLRRWFECLRRQPHAALFVSDLQRHWLPYYLFLLVCRVLRTTEVTRHDGAISVQRGFTRPELEALFAGAGARDYSLGWRWAFRYQILMMS
jgi:2-polyprenyl-3-methyl-5-hydroxy-6-metoxy-1,4-benzoquinol methylase